MGQSNAPGHVQFKRQVTIKTLVTDDFRQRAQTDLNQELQLIERQIQRLESDYSSSVKHLEKIAEQGQNVQKELGRLNQEAQNHRNQLASIKMEVSTQLANLGKVANGQYVTTGTVEDVVEIRIGDNLYEKLQPAEMLVEDGVVTGFRVVEESVTAPA